MAHYILGGILIIISIVGFLDINDLKIEDNEKINPVDDLIRKEILRNRKIIITFMSILFLVYGLDLILLT